MSETRVYTRQQNNGNNMLLFYRIKWKGEKKTAKAVCHFLEEKNHIQKKLPVISAATTQA